MTAAAIRPNLFPHLFATQRQHHKSDVAAPALSLVLHATVVAAVVLAGTTIESVDSPIIETINPIILPTGPIVKERVDAGGGPGGAIGRSLVLPQRFDEPILETPNAAPLNSANDFVIPTDPAASPKGSPGSGTEGGDTRGGFEIRSVAPALLNPQEVKRALERNYPAMLRDAGIGGRVTLWLLLDETGRVIDTDVKETSGHAAFDNAAQNIGQMMRFSPAMNRDEHVKVWVSLSIVFITK